MYNFISTNAVESDLFEGVKVTFRKMTESRRISLQLAVMEPNSCIRNLLSQIKELQKVEVEKRNLAGIVALQDEMNSVVTQKLNPAKIAWGVSSISGLTIDGEEASVQKCMEWPSELLEEVLNKIDEGAVLSEIDSKNSQSPTTSGAQTDGRPTDTSATSVEEIGSLELATAPSTTQS